MDLVALLAIDQVETGCIDIAISIEVSNYC